jgi:phosphohistidine phosphatase
MAKQLHLLRHAKSSWDDVSLGDRERGLNNRGRRDAPRMGAALAQILEPMIVTASPARRAQATLEGLVEGWPALGELEHRTEESLYTFSAADLVDWISLQADSGAPLFVLGHNPALTELVNWLCGEAIMYNLPTAGYAGLELDCESWSDICSGCASLQYRLFPREIPD